MFQSNLDGTEIVPLRRMNPDICAIEFTSGLIYCLTNQRKLIEFDPLLKVTKYVRENVSKWMSLTVFHKNIIYTDYSQNKIGMISIDPKQPDEILINVDHPYHAKVLHPDIQIGKFIFMCKGPFWFPLKHSNLSF